MSKKYYCSEFEAAKKKAKPKIKYEYEVRYCSRNEVEEHRRYWDDSEEDFKPKYQQQQRLPATKIPGACSCQRNDPQPQRNNPQPQPVEMCDDSSDSDSVQGYGFIDLYRSRGPHNYHQYLNDDSSDETDMNTSELFNIDRYTTCLGPQKSVAKQEEPYDNHHNHLTCLGPKKSVAKEEEIYDGPSTSKGYRPGPSVETLAPFVLDESSSSSGSSRPEPPQSIKPSKPFLPLTESYLRVLYRSASPQEPRQRRLQTEENQGFSRQDKRFMRGNHSPPRSSMKSPERVPVKNPCALRCPSSRLAVGNHHSLRSSTRFSPRCHPRHSVRFERSNARLAPRCSEMPACESESYDLSVEAEAVQVETESEVPAETESEVQAETESEVPAETESDVQAETESSYPRSESSEGGYSEYPSLGKRIVRVSKRNLEMGVPRHRCPRICAGAMQCPCMRRQTAPEPRYKPVTSPSRIHHCRHCCGCPCPATTKAKRSTFKWKTYLQPPVDDGEDQPVQSLLSPRSLAYTHSSCSMRHTNPMRESRHSKQRSSSRRDDSEEAHSEDSYLTPPDLAEFSDLPEVSSTSSGVKPDCRCSKGERLPSLYSRQTFTNVWRTEPKPLDDESEFPLTGGLYGQKEKLKYNLIDLLDVGVSFTPLFAGNKIEMRDRIRYFAIEFDKLSIKERMQDTELRFRQIRKRLAQAEERCLKRLNGRKASVWPMTPDGHRYLCPIGDTDCPPVTDETILSHVLLHHHDKGVELREIFVEDRILFISNPRSFIYGRNSCMSAMVYAGYYKDPSTLPARRFMPIRNRELPRVYARYPEHLPLFPMICRLKRSLPDDSPIGRGCRAERDDVLILWVTSVDLPYPVHVFMTVMNRRMDATRTAVLEVRPLHKSQAVLDVMHSSDQYMWLGEQDIKVLTSDESEPLYFEVSVKEFSGTLKRKPPPALTEK